LKSVASSRSLILLLLLLISSGIPGCATSPILPIDGSAPIDLAPNEALLIVHIDTDIALEQLVLNNRAVARSIGKGRHAWMVRLREGRYRWRRIELGSGKRQNLRFELEPDEELSFVVKAGKINYPGELVIRSGSLSRWGDGTLIVRNRNHSAMAVRALRRRYDRVLRSHSLHYAGASGDTFLEYYERERDRAIAPPGGDASPEVRKKTQVVPP
jgi:hypothetical protein